ncbi:MAG: hypothetical protein A3E31_13285 [Candidatus Rokubacteria bacterium RIFCSPHIGHO2_12_FULL_73_22]|nr:MAG: hypothetical protein A3D33_01450 [Candidatus Rokubacteria bacterium RIFCSPHIGHO2_02_FULL_73_26]OGL01138.1 MAG: hypothetical protein A3E31_13285 [Candidatus Rokubacteria bacterium RIFCSPHIGHO2_12_FULL_73_22]OGL07799.1 MAG: hypothetical protein A3I14_04485 [Candidatus Rokubacteria bacterium RIFCSPLOWO2_02_FULL_73_56]OGL29877.1 MAG: hypothetical protein A3G44_08160 [Candidatus Rokubacteria bacterium RIFCSPLOWO2_12_FULL_73_47]
MSPRAGGAISRFLAADGFFLSAGLAFVFLLSLIPVLLLGVSLLGFVLSTEHAAQAVVRQLTQHFPVYQKQITRALVRLVETRGASGILGTAVLVLFATPLLSAVRLILHRLLGVKAQAGFLRNLVVDAGMALLLAVLLFAASTATWVLHGLRDLARVTLPLPAEWFQLGSIVLSLGVSTLMFYLAYRFVPRHRVGSGAALAGAVLASVLWEIAKQLFRLYILEVGLYDQIYGPFGVLIAFVMFVYYSAVVFVFSAAFVAALDAGRR